VQVVYGFYRCEDPLPSCPLIVGALGWQPHDLCPYRTVTIILSPSAHLHRLSYFHLRSESSGATPQFLQLHHRYANRVDIEKMAVIARDTSQAHARTHSGETSQPITAGRRRSYELIRACRPLHHLLPYEASPGRCVDRARVAWILLPAAVGIPAFRDIRLSNRFICRSLEHAECYCFGWDMACRREDCL